jgi:hypothetical protein
MVKYLLILLIAICIFCYLVNNKNTEEFSATKKVSKINKNKSASEVNKSASEVNKSASKVNKSEVNKSAVNKSSSKVNKSASKVNKSEVNKSAVNKSVTKVNKSVSKVNKKSNNKYSRIKDKLGKATSLIEIKKLLEQAKINMKVFDYTTMLDINLAKSSGLALIDLMNILENSSKNSLDYNNTLNVLLGLDFGDNTFKIIFTNIKIQDDEQLAILNNLIEILKTLPQISISKEPTLDDIPKNIIINADKVFPLGTGANICTASVGLLNNLRGNRILGFDDYAMYHGKIKDHCKIKSEKKVITESIINPKKIQNLDQVPIDKNLGLPIVKAEFKNYQDFIDSKTKGVAKDIIQSSDKTFNIMASLYGV